MHIYACGVQILWFLSKQSRGYLGLRSMGGPLTPSSVLCLPQLRPPSQPLTFLQTGWHLRPLRPPWERPGELISIFSLLLVKYLLQLCQARNLPLVQTLSACKHLVQTLSACKHADLGWGENEQAAGGLLQELWPQDTAGAGWKPLWCRAQGASSPTGTNMTPRNCSALWAADLFSLAMLLWQYSSGGKRPHLCKDGLTGNCSEQRARKRSDTGLVLTAPIKQECLGGQAAGEGSGSRAAAGTHR